MAETNKKLSDKEILESINKDTGKPPTWADIYNRWFANEYLPWINSVQGSNVKVSDLAVSKDGTIIPNASVPLWNWNTGGDTAAQKAALDQRYIASLDAYNKEKGTNIQPDKAVLGANVQPNSTYRAADSGSWWTDLRDTVEAAGVVAGNYFLPGSSLLTSQLVSEGAQEQLGSDVGMLANIAAGGAGAYGGNLANYGTVGEALGVTSGATGATAGTSGGLMSGTAGTGATLGSSGVGLTGAGTSAYGGLGAGLGEATAAGGIGGSTIGGVGLTAGAGAAYGGLGAGLGTSAAALGTGSLLGTGAASSPAAAAAAGATTGAGALTASELAKANLIQGGLGLVGGLLQGNTAQNAMEADAAARAKLAAEVRDMGKFQPVGTTTRFGTSSFVTDPTTGAITPSYTLSPEAKAYQDSLSALGTQGLQAGQTMMNLGQQYVGESPEAVRQRYMATQNALLAPGNEQALAGIRNNLLQTGRQGLAYGATEAGGMGATNPELAAYYNSLANQQRQLAAGAETQYQNQVNFGTGLLGSATTPFTNVFTAQKGVELAGQQPLELSTNFANTVATRGAAQGANYATAMNPSLQSSYNAANYNPYATALQGAANNPLVGQGLLNAWS